MARLLVRVNQVETFAVTESYEEVAKILKVAAPFAEFTMESGAKQSFNPRDIVYFIPYTAPEQESNGQPQETV